VRPRIVQVEPGSRFNRWTVVGEPVEKSAKRMVLCRCDCGTERAVALHSLRSNGTKSCGCHRRDRAAAAFRTHGLTKHPHYPRWQQIVTRCTNPASRDYPGYGGRGIGVHPGWQQDPAAFIAYLDDVLGPCPAGYTLDRINNDGNYEPGNLRWADGHTQVMNRRRPEG